MGYQIGVIPTVGLQRIVQGFCFTYELLFAAIFVIKWYVWVEFSLPHSHIFWIKVLFDDVFQ